MELIKDLGVATVKSYRTRFALFKCPHCLEVVKRRASNGERNKRLHETWVNMKTRCLNPKYAKAHRYSQRGISLCDEWYNFRNFLEWAKGNGYKKNLQIDRRDNNKGYNAKNCRFVTASQNAQNKECNTINMGIATKIRKLKREGLNNTEISNKLKILRKSVSLITLNKQWVESN